MSVKVVILPGDGIGPEVMVEAMKVLDHVNADFDLGIETELFQCGAEYYTETGEAWQDDARESCDLADAIMLGAVGNPTIKKSDGNSPASEIIIHLRNGLDLFANLRPVKPLPGAAPLICGKPNHAWNPGDVEGGMNVDHRKIDLKNIDLKNINLMIVRENTEGLYCRRGKISGEGEGQYALDERIMTRRGCERIHQFAFRYARETGRNKVTCVDKSNVLQGCRFFRSIFDEVAADYPGITREYNYVDAFMLRVLKSPETVEVAVMANLFGDIVSDGAALLPGGMGMAPSANIGYGKAMFEPVHGSAPDIAGTGKANPTAMILSVKMMLEWWAAPWREGGKEIGKDARERFTAAAERIESAVVAALARGGERRELLPFELGGGATCKDFGDYVVKELERAL